MTTPRQLDLFSGAGAVPGPAPGPVPGPVPGPRPRAGDPRRLSDVALIQAIPGAGQSDAPGLAREAARRRLAAAVPALESLCRGFAGFGLDREIAEQAAALGALAEICGQPAAESVTRLIVSRAVAGPGLARALASATALGCVLPPERIAAWLRDDDPAIRAAACRCARPHAAVIAALLDCLSDLHPPVAEAAALALGRLGRREAAGILLRLLAAEPAPAVIASLAPVADDDACVRLGQTARTHPDLAPTVLAALEESEAPRAPVVAAGVRRALGLSG